jgi:hypothetical protein
MSAQIIFHRGTGWVDRARAYKIVIDGEECGRLKRNSSLKVEIPAGPHEITAKIDWCGGNVIFVDAKEGGVTEIDVSNQHGALRSQFIISSAPDTYLSLVPRRGDNTGPWA